MDPADTASAPPPWTLDPSIKWTSESLRMKAHAWFHYFADDAVELEFHRFAHTADFVLASVVNMLVGLVTIVSVLLGMKSDSASLMWLIVHLTSGGLLCGASVLEIVTCLLPAHDTIAKQQKRLYVHTAINMVAWFGYAVAECGVIFIADPYCGDTSPMYATAAFSCYRSIKTSTSAAIWGLCAFIRCPEWCWPMVILAFLAQALAFGSTQRPSGQDFGFRVACSFVWLVFCMFGNWHRDKATHRYFADLVSAIRAKDEAVLQRTELITLLDYAIPRKLLPQLTAVHGQGDDLLLNVDFSQIVAASSPDALVAVTAPVNFTRIATTQRLQELVVNLHLLCTLFDDAADRMEVDRATVFGDQYVVTSGLLGGTKGNVDRMCAFARWQINACAVINNGIQLHAVVARGELTGRFSGYGTLHYIVQGAAVRTALALLPPVPAREVWVSGSVASGMDSSRLGRCESLHLGSDASSAYQLRETASSSAAAAEPAPSQRDAPFASPPTLDGSVMITLYASASDIPNQGPSSTKSPSRDPPTQTSSAEPPPLALPSTVRHAPALPSTPSIRISEVLPIRGVFASDADEAAYRDHADQQLLLNAVDLFRLVAFLTFSILAITIVERTVDSANAYPNTVGADIAFFTLHGSAFVVSLWLAIGRHRLSSNAKGKTDADFSNPLATSGSEAQDGDRDSPDLNAPRPEKELSAAVEGIPVDLTPPRFGTGVVLLHTTRVMVVWISLALVAMTSLIALQRSGVTNSPLFLAVAYAYTAAAIVFSRAPWYVSSIASVATCIAPLAVVVPMHIGRQVGTIVFVFGAAATTVLCSRVGCQLGRQSFAAKRIAALALDVVLQNESLLRRVIKRQVPEHVSERGLRALRRSVFPSDDSRPRPQHKLGVFEFSSEFVYLSLRILTRSARCEFDVDIFRVANSVAHFVEASKCLLFLQALGDELTVGGPPAWSDPNVSCTVSEVARLLTGLATKHPQHAFIASASLEECCGAILGNKAMRYRVFGIAMLQSVALLDAASMVYHPSIVARSPQPNTLVCTRRFKPILDTVNDAVGLSGSPFSDPPTCVLKPSGPQRWMVRDLGLVHVHAFLITSS